MSLEKLTRQRLEIEKSLSELEQCGQELDIRSTKTLSNMREIADETLRVADVAYNAPHILEELDTEFEKQTGLKGLDMKFLFVATALQCARQYILTPFQERQNAIKEEAGVKDYVKKIAPKDWKHILTSPVPFDAIKGSKDALGVGLSGINHRAKTLGHDPLLGWVFGTANIMTDTISLSDFRSFQVIDGSIVPGEVSTWEIVTCPANVLLNGEQEKKIGVGLALLKEGIHLNSDIYSHQSLPIPIINSISPGLGAEISNYGFDMANIIFVGKQAVLAIAINAIIAMVHRMFYDESSGMSKKLYEVKTRKILSYSNLIASTSNVIGVAIATIASPSPKNALKFLDIGGILVTLYRIATDIKFIHRLKREFITEHFNEMIRGKEYDFE